LLDRFLTNTRSFYKDIDITLICDGYYQKFQEELCSKHNCNYILGDRLKTPDKGNEWISRFLKEYRKKDTDLMVQLDPDAVLYREFKFPDLDYFGDVQVANNKKFINGFCVGITRHCRDTILESNLLQTKDYSQNTYTKKYGVCFRYETSFFDMVQTLDLSYGQWVGITYTTVPTHSNLSKYLTCSHQPI
jgi:hypothetical protein